MTETAETRGEQRKLPRRDRKRRHAICDCPQCGYDERKQWRKAREAGEEDQRARMSAFAAIADLACFQDHDEVGRAQFILELEALVGLVHDWKHAPRKLLFSKNSDERQKVLKAAKALRAASAALEAFGKEGGSLVILLARAACPAAFHHPRVAADDKWLASLKAADDEWLASLRTVMFGLSALAGVSPFTANRSKRGRPAGSRNDWLLSAFVTALHQRAVDGGGEFTASHKDGKGYGTIFEALELLRPHLPEGFLRTNAVQAIVSAVKEGKTDPRGVPDRYVRNSNKE
jgi:hypothetical protein